MKKIIIVSLITGIFFFVLSFTEFVISRRDLVANINQHGPSISIVSYDSKQSNSLDVTWVIDSSLRTNTQTTSIYYDYESTPSAVTVNDSPESLSYQYHTNDYIQGSFPIPQTFFSRINLPKKDKVYFRGYTYLNGQHLWTPEYQFEVK